MENNETAQEHLDNALASSLSGNETIKAVSEFEKALALGLPGDKAAFARVLLGGEYSRLALGKGLPLTEAIKTSEWSQSEVETTTGLRIDREGGLGVFSAKNRRATLSRFDILCELAGSIKSKENSPVPGSAWHLFGCSVLGWFQEVPGTCFLLNQGEAFNSLRFASEEIVELSPIPCWAHLSPAAYRRRVRALVDDIDAEAARDRKISGRPVLGVAAILAQDPQLRPAKLDRSPAPRVHAATKAARKLFYEAYAAFVSAFRAATEALRQGNRDAPFPRGSFPPALPFVAG